jgi:hypothetical protein
MRALGALTIFVSAAFANGPGTEAVAILQARCVSCHGKATAISGLDLSSAESFRKGGQRGPALRLILKAVRREGPLAMPPTQALSPKEVEILDRWIAAGAEWPAHHKPGQAAANWWSFQPVIRPAIPAVPSAWARNPVDRFLLAKMSEQGLSPAPEATPAALARRVSYNLTGLPLPSERLQSLTLSDYPKLVDELLASPHYGEKWGRHWLDLVRYSDTAGFELDSYIADAWRYRDWVIDSFNADKPYDRFIKEQLAGDEFFPEDPVAQTGTGFFCVGPNRDLFPDQADINRVETLTDFVDTTGGVFLGLTVGCARCHDHKFDPIPQRDYYRLQAVFAPAVKTRIALNRLTSLGFEVGENVREIKLREIGEEIGVVQARCREKFSSQDDIRGCLNPEESARLHEIEKRLVGIYASYRAKPFACGLTDVGDYAPKTYVPVRGSAKGEPVNPGFLSLLGGGDTPPDGFERPTTGPIPLTPTTGRRKALAEWIASPGNPLTARVMVNRIWQYHFGRGLVSTPSDFGSRARGPSHPELLDYLAAEFVQSGWSVKALHRLILNSAAYRQSATPNARDPENAYVSYFSRRRLDAEELRDSTLDVTGRLNRARGGRPVVPPLSKEEMFGMIGRASESWVQTADETQHRRRSIYLIQKRTFRLPMMEVFDQPESMLTCSRRDVSTTAPQALTLLNGSFVIEHAQAFAARLAVQSNPVETAWRAVLRRDPSPTELRSAQDFLARQTTNTGSPVLAAAELVRGLLNTNEFLYLD